MFGREEIYIPKNIKGMIYFFIKHLLLKASRLPITAFKLCCLPASKLSSLENPERIKPCIPFLF